MTQQMLDKAYGLENADKTRTFYDEWAASYDDEISQNGYATPQRCAKALAQFVDDKSAPLLDIGCGTGISGLAMRDVGFTTISGCDFSPQMLDKAREKDVYRELINTNLEEPFPFKPGSYSNVSAIGVLNPGHAPASTLDEIMGLLKTGGHLVFSLNDHALEDPTYEARLNEHLDSGNASLLFREYGPHLPKIDLKSNVYVLEKL